MHEQDKLLASRAHQCTMTCVKSLARALSKKRKEA